MQLDLVFELLVCWVRRDLVVVSVFGNSMLPTLRASDTLLCSRSRPRLLGSIVVAERSTTEGRIMRHIKRLTGLAGDVFGAKRLTTGLAWIEGDNSQLSTDSREWGPIRIERIAAVAIATLRSNQLIDLRPQARRARGSLAAQLIEVWRDWSRSIRTRGVVRPDAFGFSMKAVHTYVPTPWEVARLALQSIEISVDDVFVDYGCGRGRLLIVALDHRFRRVVGIELLPTLVADARRNVARFGERCEVIEGDAAALPLPDDATVLYMFNAFGDDVLADVVKRIRESLSRRPRRLRLITFAVEPVLLESLLAERPNILEGGLALFSLGAAGERDERPPDNARTTRGSERDGK
jgi:SAM-dependent methyltransferase